MKPYYQDELVTLYHGDFRDGFDCVPAVDAVITDPPYAETTHEWDSWPQGWPALMAEKTNLLWSWGSMRMFLNNWEEFSDWKFSQEIIWRKNTHSSPATDRFKRIHELAFLFYRGSWGNVRHSTPKVVDPNAKVGNRKKFGTQNAPHWGLKPRDFDWVDDGKRFVKSVIDARNANWVGVGNHPTGKPVKINEFLVDYSVAPGGVVLDPFAGGGSTLLAARNLGRRVIGFEIEEKYCELIVNRLSQQVFDFNGI